MQQNTNEPEYEMSAKTRTAIVVICVIGLILFARLIHYLNQ